ncbi:hypothetical protein QYE76_039210 [Lolium multiflorum]|uniref:Transposase (putative) gypsy type domain-containing protein n=1 Tax=Lolium multiflorum TaxID=4521 RepID=A0AAD8WRL8_LOLMU|nr:hypothetical protein QYE76_039210 [Lolium multiflorum]
MREDDIERLVRLRRISSEVITRVPGDEVEPRPNPGERVVFGAHFDRGLGLPASHFFRRFLDFFGLQPHHLPANACVLLSCYVAFMEGYAGLWPDIDFGSRLFFIKAQPMDGRLRACGAASIYSRPGTPFPKIPTVDSVKKWHMSFFYVRNENPAFDRLNLPEYNPAPPVSRINWGHNARTTDPDAEVNLLWDFLGACVSGSRMSAEDLLCTYAERRVLPLQMRVHKIGHMSGRFDPTRTSKVELTRAQVARRVNNVTKANMPENWDWGLVPHSRASPPELLFDRQGIEDGDLAQRIWTPDHADPADQAGDQAGDDELPEVPDEGGQGAARRPREQRGGGGGGRRRPPRGRSLRCPCAWAACRLATAPKGKKRVDLAPRRRRRAAIKFTQGGGSRPAPRVVSPLPRQRREADTPAFGACAHAAHRRRAACG